MTLFISGTCASKVDCTYSFDLTIRPTHYKSENTSPSCSPRSPPELDYAPERKREPREHTIKCYMNLTPQSRSALAPISPPLFFFSGKGLFFSVLRLDSWASFMFSRSKESGLLLLASLVTSSENGASPWSHNRKQLVRPFQFIILTSSYSPTSSYSFISQVWSGSTQSFRYLLRP